MGLGVFGWFEIDLEFGWFEGWQSLASGGPRVGLGWVGCGAGLGCFGFRVRKQGCAVKQASWRVNKKKKNGGG